MSVAVISSASAPPTPAASMSGSVVDQQELGSRSVSLSLGVGPAKRRLRIRQHSPYNSRQDCSVYSISSHLSSMDDSYDGSIGDGTIPFSSLPQSPPSPPSSVAMALNTPQSGCDSNSVSSSLRTLHLSTPSFRDMQHMGTSPCGSSEDEEDIDSDGLGGVVTDESAMDFGPEESDYDDLSDSDREEQHERGIPDGVGRQTSQQTLSTCLRGGHGGLSMSTGYARRSSSTITSSNTSWRKQSTRGVNLHESISSPPPSASLSCSSSSLASSGASNSTSPVSTSSIRSPSVSPPSGKRSSRRLLKSSASNRSMPDVLSPPRPENEDKPCAEFKQLRDRCVKEIRPKISFDSARCSPNMRKNRYPDILPNEHTRVRLNPLGYDGSDYINANFVGEEGKKRYIACQAPIPTTFDDFWRMAYEQRSAVIVMLTNLIEGRKRKAHQYWPAEEGGSERYGCCRVTLLREGHFQEVTVRRIKLEWIGDGEQYSKRKEYDSFEVFHLLWTGWGDMGVPKDLKGLRTLFRLWKLCKPVTRRTGTQGPPIIHCSAGVGRSGSLIAIDMVLRKAVASLRKRALDADLDRHELREVLAHYDANPNDLERVTELKNGTCRVTPLVEMLDRLLHFGVADVVHTLRWQRIGMIQTLPQYVFVYNAVCAILVRDHLPVLHWALSSKPLGSSNPASSSPVISPREVVSASSVVHDDAMADQDLVAEMVDAPVPSPSLSEPVIRGAWTFAMRNSARESLCIPKREMSMRDEDDYDNEDATQEEMTERLPLHQINVRKASQQTAQAVWSWATVSTAVPAVQEDKTEISERTDPLPFSSSETSL